MSYEGEHESWGHGSSSSHSQTPSSNKELKTAMKLRCPICDQPFDRAASTAMPFCSSRCRQIDLGRWLNESYSMPCEGNDHAEGFEPDE